VRPRVKICCIQDPEEAALAVDAGADAIGIVGPGLSGPEVIEDFGRIAAIAASVPPPVGTVFLTREDDPRELAAQVVASRCSIVQLCDQVSPAAWAALRAAAPSVRILQAVHVQDDGALQLALQAASFVDAILLDSGAPAGASPVFGGTGRTHDWRISARVVQQVRKPVWLAGGLRPENVEAAWAAVQPWGLDVCSGVRSGGRLDPLKVRALCEAARGLWRPAAG
jgi:phosphoribosylanthranilate isomerase